MDKKSFYKDSSFNMQILMGVIATAMIAVSIYLTNHYFQVKFPTSITEASGICNINSFFNCDTTTNSPLSNIAGVPISLFGILMGVFIFAGFLFKNEETEKTNHLILLVNAIGCFVLFLYSLIALGGLCPMCTIYYILSWLAAFLFFKFSSHKGIDPKTIGIYAVVALISSGLLYKNVSDKESYNSKIADSLLKQYWGLPNLGNPAEDSKFRIVSASENFSDAPLQITFFSDFQCPACKALSNNTHQIINKYKGKINIQYMFYPLDHNCNPSMQRPLHTLACQGAYLASCLPTKFAKVHDDIFNNQESLTLDWLQSYAKKEGVLECMQSAETKKSVQDIIAASSPFNIRSTPTMLVNGVKIEGVLPLSQLYIILDDILKKSGK
ncbi:thioredoxin domain-containing protein [Halobacteriovorax sp. HLS]|uniref:vitamin K epoxide reductase/DsbA family protein n=1 Tax=Halobacteriovorax sp. HLS TaxID=2234000 RepID=UPI000FDC0C88|nr:thioredoxin domain-containing protein [Halobacteriovorax sp. HLS]